MKRKLMLLLAGALIVTAVEAAVYQGDWESAAPAVEIHTAVFDTSWFQADALYRGDWD